MTGGVEVGPAGGARPGVDVRRVAVFLAVAFGWAWLVCLPLWLSGRGLVTPWTPVLLLAMMLGPTVATLAVAGRHGPSLRVRGLRVGWVVLAWLGPFAVLALAMLLSVAAGTYRVDLVGFSGFVQVAGPVPEPVANVVWMDVVLVPLVGWFNAIPALAEEYGWRGWLLPALLPLGRWPAVLSVGVVWGLWHAPVVLLGYNYPRHAPVGSLLLMVAFTLVTGTLLGWLRLRSGSVWPCAVAHGFVNAAAGVPVLLAAAGPAADNAQSGLLGWPGWVAMLAAFGLAAALLRRPAGITGERAVAPGGAGPGPGARPEAPRPDP